MNVLAFAASNSRNSINRQLVMHAGNILKTRINSAASIEIIDLNDYEMPIYSIDRQTETSIPQAAQRFFEKISAADALLISFAEHNGSYTAAYKNLFDWASRIQMKVYQDKPMVVMSTSIGKNGGASVLKGAIESAPFFGADIRGHLAVGPFSGKFGNGALTDPVLAEQLHLALTRLSEPKSEK
jgi:NAD(P)H-dependent FMN reductase